MTRLRTRTATGLVLGSLAMIALPAGADHAFFASSSATGLEVTLAGQGLTIGSTDATIQSVASDEGCGSGTVACANAVGLLLGQEPLTTGVASASSPGDEGPNDATGFPIPEGLNPLLAGAIGPAQAAASGTEDPSASSDAGVFELAVTATQTLADNLPVQDILDEVGTQVLDPIADGDPTGIVGRVRDTVDLISTNLSETPILTIAGGPSSSTAESRNGVVTATGSAHGVNITVVPTPANLPTVPDGLVVIQIGAASATVSSDQFEAKADFDAALVRLKFLDPGSGEYDVIEIPVNASECTPFAGTPLEPLTVCVTVADGTTSVEGAKASASAAGVAITAFADPLPQVRIATAAADAVVNAAPPADEPPAAPAAPPASAPPSLPRTGAAAVLPALGLLGLAITALRRRG